MIRQPKTLRLPRKPGHDLVDTIIYGPVLSRRLGWSLGINVFAPKVKVCNFDCVYCQLGPTLRLPRKEDFLPTKDVCRSIAKTLERLAEKSQPLDVLTLSGNGEPTLHPGLGPILQSLIEARNHWFPKAQTWILTNGSRIHIPAIVNALNDLDERAIKLDATGPWIAAIDRPWYGFRLERMLQHLPKLRDYHLQIMLNHGPGENSSPTAAESWARTFHEFGLTPKSIQIYTVDRYPAYPGVSPLTKEEMVRWVEKIQRLVSCPVVIFPG